MVKKYHSKRIQYRIPMKTSIFSALISVFLITGFCAPAAVFAQQDQESTLLPSIDPQDIEIRGEFRARFPGLSRQPILGFDPNLRIYQIDPNRQPFMESGDAVVANLPVSELSRPAPPDYTALRSAEDINVFTRAGAGSYISPEINFWAAVPINTQSYVGGDVDFSSSDGHLDDRPSSFRFLTANGEFGTRLNEKTELRLHGGVQSDFNQSANFGNSTTPNATISRIEHEGFNGGAEVSRFANEVTGWKLQANVRNFSTTFRDDALGGIIEELTYNGSFSSRWALGNAGESITLNAGARGGSYEPNIQPSETWATLQGGVAYDRLFNYQTNVHAEANVFYASNPVEDKVYPGGLLKIDHWFGDRLKITGKAEGKPQLSSVEQLHERNRFLGFSNNLRHTYSLDVTGKAFIKYYRGSKIHGGVTYSNAQDYAFFTPGSVSNPAGNGIDNYTVNYQNATNFKLFAGITHQLLPERFWVSAQVYTQNPELNGGAQIPFEETWGINASTSFKPIERITIEGWANFTGKRETNIANNNAIDSFILVGARLDIEIIDNLGAYAKGVNLLDQNYEVWRGYQERPLQVYGGITFKF